MRAGELAGYDVVVVGAGTAGCVVSARLSEEPSRRVLLIEAGPYYGTLENYPRGLTMATSFGPSEPGHPLNWSFVGTSGAGRRYPLVRGRVFGGTSALNGSAWLRATQDDYARWSTAGGGEWTEERVLPHYIKSEDDLDFGMDGRHGGAGPLEVARAGYDTLTTTANAFIKACQSHGMQVLADLNGPDSVGVGIVPTTERQGTRTNTAIAYLEPVIDRPNLTVLDETTARRVLVSGECVQGVEAVRAGEPTTFHAAEVVLCAGAIQSPHLLMLSGIGPADHLRGHGIAVIHDNAAVGTGFVDHMKFPLSFQAENQPAPPPEAPFHEVALHYTGAASGSAGDLQIIPPSTALLRAQSESDGSLDGRALGLMCIQNAPWARGQIRLASHDPSVRPELAYGSDPRDQSQGRDLARTAASLLRNEAFAALGVRRSELGRETLERDQLLDKWIASRLGSANHLCASARIGSATDENAVVDAYGQVHGIQGLRIADLSIVDGITRGPYATAVMVGEKISSSL